MTKRQTKQKFIKERTPDPIKPLTAKQREYLEALKHHDQIIVTGCAGTGKSYIAGTWGADALRSNRVSKLVITRPNVPGGRSLGFFPGSLEDKLAPWVAPLVSILSDRLGAGAYDTAVKAGNIEIVPFEVMRGRTFENAFVILDETQNTTPHELKM